MGLRLTVDVCNMISHLSSLGYPIFNTTTPTPLFNNSNTCVQSCHDMMTKGNCHIKNWENLVCKWVEDGTLTVTHVGGKCNPANIFTKEQDGANFCRLRNSLMCQSSDFVKHIFNNLHPLTKPLDTSTIGQSMLHRQQTTSHPRHQDSLMSSYLNHCFSFSPQSHAY
jgi:hypothetical protein